MRIVDVCAFYSPRGGGVRTYIDAKLRAAARLGNEIVILAPGPNSEVREIAPGGIVATLPSPPLPVDRRYHYFNDERLLWRTLDMWRPDHVECSSPWSSASMVARWDGPAHRSLVMHSDPLSAYAYRWLGGILPRRHIDRLFSRYWNHLRSLDRSFDVVVTWGEEFSRRLIEGGLTRVSTVPLGIEAGRFSPELRREELRQEILEGLGLDGSGTLLIGVGRFGPEKRWDMVIRAAGELGRSRSVALALIGDGPRRQQLEMASARFPNVRLLPHLNDRNALAQLLASADALVHGCEAETFGLAVAEARASGIPLIVPDRGGAHEQLTEGCGFAYRSGSERSLSEALLRFIESGPDRLRQAAIRSSLVRDVDHHFRELFARYISLPARPALVGAAERAAAAAEGAYSFGADAVGY
jgi:alpha-1,6-mannosyltransferase